LMFIAEGYAAVKQTPFSPKNIVATYIGVALYVLFYGGYVIYERFILKIQRPHFVPLLQVDLVTDAVWQEGEGDQVREKDRQQKLARRHSRGLKKSFIWSIFRHIY